MVTHQYRYTVLFEPAEEGGYVVTCPALPGLVTEGNTLEEARAMAVDAIRGYLESLAKDGLPDPTRRPGASRRGGGGGGDSASPLARLQARRIWGKTHLGEAFSPKIDRRPHLHRCASYRAF